MEPVTEQLGLDVADASDAEVDAPCSEALSATEADKGFQSGDAPGAWLFLTNRQNLLEVLSSGLLAPADTYGKYYNDLLALAPGRVPLWSGPPPASALEAVVDADNPGSFPVLVEVHVPPPDGPMLELQGTVLVATDTVVPTGEVRVYVRSQGELTELTTQEHENIDHRRVTYEVDGRRFAGVVADTDSTEWLRGLKHGQDRTWTSRQADSVSGALALVAQAIPARPDSWSEYARLLRGEAPLGEGHIPVWLTLSALRGVRPDAADVDAVLFSAAAEVFGGDSEGRPSAALDRIVQVAKAGKAARGVPKLVEMNLAWVADVLALEKEFSEGKPVPAARSIAAALLRPEPKRLMGFNEGRQDIVSFVAAAALVGLRAGRRRLAVELRPAALDGLLAGLAAAISDGRENQLLASASVDGDSVLLEAEGRTLMTAKIQAPSISEVLSSADLSAGRGKSAALEIALRMEWSDCVDNELVLPGREFDARYDSKRQRVVIGFQGFPRIERRIAPEVFLARLASTTIPQDLAEEVLAQFNAARE